MHPGSMQCPGWQYSWLWIWGQCYSNPFMGSSGLEYTLFLHTVDSIQSNTESCHLQISGQLSPICTLFCKLQPPCCLLNSDRLVSFASVSPPWARVWKLSPGSTLKMSQGLTFFISHLSGVTLPHCLMSTVLRTTLSVHCPCSPEKLQMNPVRS